MEFLKYTLKGGQYTPRIKQATYRMSYISSLLETDVRMSKEAYLMEAFEKVFTGESEGFSTDVSDIDRVDDNHLRLRDLSDLYKDSYEESGIIIEKKQLYYLIDEWIRLTKMRVQEITVTYDNSIYTIEGK